MKIRAIALFIAAMLIMAIPVYANNVQLTPPQLTIRFAPSPGYFPDGVSGIRTGILGFRIDEFPTPVPPEGYTFIGWFSDGVLLDTPVAAVRSTTILAGYAPVSDSNTAPSFAIMYNPGEGQLPEGVLPIQSLTYGSALVGFPVPTLAGYYFSGWQLNGDIINAPYIVRNDMALEALWTDVPMPRASRPVAIPDNQFVVVFHPFPGAFDGDENGMRFSRNTIASNDLPAEPSRQGYIFNGWRMPNGAQPSSGFTIQSDTVLMAIWEADPEAENNGNGAEMSSRPPIDTIINPPTNPIAISLMIFGAVGMLAIASFGIYVLKIRHAAAEGRYHAYITRCVREVRIVIRSRANKN